MKQPAIYIFTTAYEPFIGGAEVAIRETVSRLSRSFSFFIFTARLSPQLPHVEEKDGITIIRVGFGNRTDKLFLAPLIVFDAIRRFRTHPPALLWSVMISYAFPAALILKWWRRVPLLLTLQEGNREWEFQWNNLGMSWLGWRVALKTADFTAAISSFLLELSRSLGYRGEGSIIPNGVDLSHFASVSGAGRVETRKRLGIPDEAFLLITTSRLVHKNGIDIVLSAIDALPLEVKSKTHFLVVGGGDLLPYLTARTKELRLEQAVHFIGEKRNDELPELYQAADLFVRPSRSEGLGISFIEAMASGLPTIGARVGGIPDVIEDGETGFLVEPEDPKGLAEVISHMAKNTKEARRISERGITRAHERFSWEHIVNAYEALFSRLIIQRRRILIATGIYPPDIGGVSGIAKKFKEALSSDFRVSVFSYGKTQNDEVLRTTRNVPTGIRHLVAFFRALPLVWRVDLVFLLDHFSMGFPVAVAARIFFRPYIVRVGGDFLWEGYVESSRRGISLPDYYEKGEWTLFETAVFYLARWTLRGADRVVFTTEWQRDIFIRHYGLSPDRVLVIQNAAPEVSREEKKGRRTEIIYAGRFIYLKNLDRLIRTFHEWRQKAKSELRLRLIGEGPEEKRIYALIRSYGMEPHVTLQGPMEKRVLMEAVAKSRAVIVPSFSDISPNLVLEALRAGVPAVLTTHSGFSFSEKEGVLRIDPKDVESIRGAFESLLAPKRYAALLQRARGYAPSHTENQMLESYSGLIESFLA